MSCCEIFLKVGGKNKMEELSSLGVNLILIRLEGIQFLLKAIGMAVWGILGCVIGLSIMYYEKNKGK